MIEDLTQTAEQRAFAEAAERSFGRCAGLSPEEIPQCLATDGFLAMLSPEAFGGLGLGLRAALPVVRAAGRQLLAFPLVEAMLSTDFAARHGAGVATEMLSGRNFATIAWGGEVAVRSGRAQGVAARAPGAGEARWLICRARHDDREAAVLINLHGAGVEIVAADDLDVDRIYADVVLRDAAVIALAAGGWRTLADAGAILRAGDMIGAAEASFTEACTHVSTRRQFGKPLSARQAISGQLARDHFALVGAGLSVEYAAFAFDAEQGDASVARDVACAVAQDACVAAAENAIQLHGALGFTWAMPLHRRLRRIQAAADIYSAKTARENLAEALLGVWREAA